MKKKPWIVVLFALLVIAAVSFTLSSGSAKDAVPQTGNLIANGDFSIFGRRTAQGLGDRHVGDERGRVLSGKR